MMNSPFFDSTHIALLKLAIKYYEDRNDPQINMAIVCSFIAHGKKLDKEGAPYFCHPLNVSKKLETSEEIMVALLHDVLEDSKITELNLKSMGFSDKVIEAVKILTRKKTQSYKSYLYQVSRNALSLKVKRADILDNLDPLRLSKLSRPLQCRLRNKYEKALKLLDSFENH